MYSGLLELPLKGSNIGSVSSYNSQYITSASQYTQQSRGQIHPRIYEIFETDEKAMSRDFNMRKQTLLKVQKTIKRLYKIKTFYAKFGLTLDVENLDLG